MKFGLIGHPIAHSLSPALFKAGYAGRYPYDLIETPDFEEAYQIFLNEYDGINVTAPFKELALKKADIISEECNIVGATNLLIKTPEGVKAHNSDYLGVREWLYGVVTGLERTPVAPCGMLPPPAAKGAACFLNLQQHQKRHVLIVGIGGAGKAATAAARALGMEVTVLNRTIYSNEIKPLSAFREEFRKADIVIYNLPVRIPELDTLTEEDFTPGRPKHILEANYRNPSFDKALIQKMQQTNLASTYTEGQVWLLLQAVTGYEIFTGESPDESSMKEVIKSK
ncbi:MAG: hypothetical protein IJ307_06015 [Bacteroidales bacterium]|nr:hypothetical protein [Bacteroidales bacterium]